MNKMDPRRITAKFGACKACGKPVKGIEVIYWPRFRNVYCRDCGEQDFLRSKSMCYEEDTGRPFAY